MFWHRQRDIKALVHGDDFVSSGERPELEWSCKGPKKKSETDDHGGRGRRHGQGGESIEPNREMAPEKDITYEADPRHADKIIRDTGAENVETISTRGTRPRQRERKMKRRRGSLVDFFLGWRPAVTVREGSFVLSCQHSVFLSLCSVHAWTHFWGSQIIVT